MGKDTSYRPLKREFSAGGVVFKKNKGKTLFLITKSTPSDRIPKSVCRLPKGWIDNKGEEFPGEVASGQRRGKEEEIRSAALREVEEEGGVKAKILEKLGTVKLFFSLKGEKILKFVTFYLMQWTSDLPQGPGKETESIEWLSFDKAHKKLKYQSEKEVLSKANKALERGIQENLL